MPKGSIPIVVLSNTDIPIRRKGKFLYAQTQDLTTDLTLRLWNLCMYKLFLRSIIGPVNIEFIPILNTIANYLNVHLDHGTLTVKRIGLEYESR